MPDAATPCSFAEPLAATGPLPVHVLTGFLGSGKTTILTQLLASHALDSAVVLINELGDIGIDHLLVRHVREDVVLLSSGCVCCTLRRDLSRELDTLWQARARGEIPPFTRVLLETTGLAEPGPIVQTLVKDAALSLHFYLAGVVATVDGELGAQTLAAHHEARLQVALADRIVITKSDRARPEALTALNARIRSLNPDAPLVMSAHGDVAADFVLAVGHLDTRQILARNTCPSPPIPPDQAHEPPLSEGPHGHDTVVQRTAMVLTHPVDYRAFSLWVSMLTQLHGPRVLRLKAVLSAIGEPQPIAVQAVQHVVYPPLDLPPMAKLQGRSFVVVLTQGMSETELAELRAELGALGAQA